MENEEQEKNKFIRHLAISNSIVVAMIAFTNKVMASNSTGIGTAEVEAATNNIQRVITSIAMPLGRGFNLC